MNEKDDFSMEESEELISQLKKESTTQLPQLESALRLLARVPVLSHSSMPPLLPSAVGQNVLNFSSRSKSHRTIITSILAAGILASASLAAAAVTGNTPAPISTALHKSAELARTVAGAISNAVTGNNSDDDSEDDSDIDEDQPSGIGPSLTPPPVLPADDEDQGDEQGDESGNSQGDDQGDDDKGEKLQKSPRASGAPLTKPQFLASPGASSSESEDSEDDHVEDPEDHPEEDHD